MTPNRQVGALVAVVAVALSVVALAGATGTVALQEDGNATATPTGTPEPNLTATPNGTATAGNATATPTPSNVTATPTPAVTPTQTPEPSAVFDVTDLTAPANATVGEEVTLTANVTNIGEVEATKNVTFRLGGPVVERRNLSLDPGESETVSFTVDTDGRLPGEYVHGVFTDERGEQATLVLEPPAGETASFSVDGVGAPENATVESTVSFTATLTNPNDRQVTQTVELRFVGIQFATQEVTLDAGETRTVTFEVNTTGFEPTEITYAVFTRDDGQFGTVTLGTVEAS